MQTDYGKSIVSSEAITIQYGRCTRSGNQLYEEHAQDVDAHVLGRGERPLE